MIDLQKATRAYYWVSFSPEKRGQSFKERHEKEAEEIALELSEAGVDMEEINGWTEKYFHYCNDILAKQGRCMSSMITGPARFPTAKAERANNSLRDAEEKFSEWIKKSVKRLKKKNEEPVDEIEALKTKIQNMEEKREAIKKHNKSGAERAPSYLLTNLGANIRSSKERLEMLQKKATMQNSETVETIMGEEVTILKNYEEDRLQIIFNGKPSEEIRTKLKQNGYKWSPKNNAWQRKLTGNALYSLNRLK